MEKCEAMIPEYTRTNPLLEVLFTSEWSALYDPVTRSRWDIHGLLDASVFNTLNGKVSSVRDSPSWLQESGLAHPASDELKKMDAWCEAGWEDPLRHYLHTNHLPKLNYADASGWIEDFTTMHEKVDEAAVPPLTKQHAQALAVIDLNSREPSAQQTPGEALNLTMLAELLVPTFGISGEKRLAVSGRHVLRTSPSGGSRHPTEAYVIAFEVDGLPAGVYHFNSARPSLAMLREGDFRANYLSEVFGLNRRLTFSPKAVLILTSVVERSMHRYRDPRSYRVLHFDIGHLLLTLQLLARAKGIPHFSAYSLGDSAAERMVGVDGLMEAAMCQFLLG